MHLAVAGEEKRGGVDFFVAGGVEDEGGLRGGEPCPITGGAVGGGIAGQHEHVRTGFHRFLVGVLYLLGILRRTRKKHILQNTDFHNR